VILTVFSAQRFNLFDGSSVKHVRILSIFATYTRIIRALIMDAPKAPPAVQEPDHYGAEVLCASWNPVVTAVVEPISKACRDWLADVSALDTEAFLQQFYRSQR
jgi:hypothetical protein